MSSDDQSVSIDRQRAEVEALAKRAGIKIIRTYKDEGRSGSKEPEKRVDFQRLLMDSATGDFQAVLCYNSSRFARLDTIDGAFAKQILRQNGVYLHTTTEGKIDWSTPEGRMMDFMLSEQNHAYSRSLSGDSVSGRLRALADGGWPSGATPYGYDRLYTFGDQRHRIGRLERFRKPRGWKLTLVINEEEAAVVRRIFNLYVNQAMSQRQICMLLNDEKVPPPDGNMKRGWTSIDSLLEHKAYVGIAEIGVGRKSAKKAFKRIAPAEKAGVCPRLVDGDTFQRCQRMLAAFRARHQKCQSARAGLLSGFLYCARCGGRLTKHKARTGQAVYVCVSRHRRCLKSGCPNWRVYERDLILLLVQKVISTVDMEILKALDDRPRKADVIDQAELLQKQVAALERKLATARKRFLTIDDDDEAAECQKVVDALKEELSAAEEAQRIAKAMQEGGGAKSFAEWWEKERGKLAIVLTQKATWESCHDSKRRYGGRGKKRVRPVPPPKCGYFTDTRDEDATATVVENGAVFDLGTFRGFLHRLGLLCHVSWKKDGHWQVDHANVKIDLTWQGEQEGEFVSAHTSTRPE